MFLLQREMITALLFFLFLGWQDLKSRSVSCRLLLFGGILGIAVSLLNRRGPGEILPALLPGLCLLGAAFGSKGAIGMGDGIAVTLLGLYLSLKSVALVLGLAFLLAALTALLRIVRHSINRSVSLKKGLPFLSFFPPAICLFALLQT